MKDQICGDRCESRELFGQRGECINNFTCECPEGFSGVDDWTVTPDCIVNDNLALGLHIVQLVIAFIGLISTLICTILLRRRWGVSFYTTKSASAVDRDRRSPSLENIANDGRKGSMEMLSTEARSLSKEMIPDGPQLLKKDSNLSKSKSSTLGRNYQGTYKRSNRNLKASMKRKKAQKRAKELQRQSLMFCYLAFWFEIFSLPYQFVYLLQKDGRRWTIEDGYIWMNICLAFCTSTCLAAPYILLLAWYHSLPDTKFGALFQIPRFLSNYPKTIHRILVGFAIGSFIGGFGCHVLFPALTSRDNYEEITKIYLIFIFIYTLLFGVVQYLLIGVFMRSFQNGLTAVKSSILLSKTTNKHIKTLKQTIHTASIVRFISTSMVTSAVPAMVVWFIFGGRHQYLFFSISSIAPLLGATAIPIVIFYRTNGGLTPLVTPEETTQTGLD